MLCTGTPCTLYYILHTTFLISHATIVYISYGLIIHLIGPHRYVFLVFQQSGTINSRVSRNRARFNIESFAKKNKLGNPVAGNFFFAENI